MRQRIVGCRHFRTRADLYSQPASRLPNVSLLSDIRKALLEIGDQLFALTGYANGLFSALFCANPSGQFVGENIDRPTFTSDRHSRSLPALSHRDSLPEEFRDFVPSL